MRSLWLECRRVVRSSDYGRVQYRHAQVTDIQGVGTSRIVSTSCMSVNILYTTGMSHLKISSRGSPADTHSGYVHDKLVGEDAAEGRRSLCLILFSFSTSII
jgi:hypothetical protein